MKLIFCFFLTDHSVHLYYLFLNLCNSHIGIDGTKVDDMAVKSVKIHLNHSESIALSTVVQLVLVICLLRPVYFVTVFHLEDTFIIWEVIIQTCFSHIYLVITAAGHRCQKPSSC
ncbi:hypothetical protein QVD17_00198 [Tagetes erecta]|uniref:Uncharacterized protein n=1 Tax=Tagetes erecta TaxID=13708 RepID=A0AAD8LB55_TARER|nr:hypothetical protein QVD17_00198 [Tagetes erecta]